MAVGHELDGSEIAKEWYSGTSEMKNRSGELESAIMRSWVQRLPAAPSWKEVEGPCGDRGFVRRNVEREFWRIS